MINIFIRKVLKSVPRTSSAPTSVGWNSRRMCLEQREPRAGDHRLREALPQWGSHRSHEEKPFYEETGPEPNTESSGGQGPDGPVGEEVAGPAAESFRPPGAECSPWQRSALTAMGAVKPDVLLGEEQRDLN